MSNVKFSILTKRDVQIGRDRARQHRTAVFDAGTPDIQHVYKAHRSSLRKVSLALEDEPSHSQNNL